MSAQQSIHAVPPIIFLLPVFVLIVVIGGFFVISYLISRMSGWALLARRFRASEPFQGESWGWQSGRFRGWCGYNNCLRVGASEEGLFLAVALPFRLFHPSLMIPWQEIEVGKGKIFFGLYETAEFRIGREERVSLRVYGKLVNRLRQAAGMGWPPYAVEQMEGQMGR